MPAEPIAILPADPRSPDAARLIRDLSAEMAALYDFTDDGSGNFRPEDALGPRSGFLIGSVHGLPVACGAYRPMEPEVAEIKRMYVSPEYRGRGYSKALLAELERFAARAGYRAIRLETGNRQPEAIGLYIRAGYRTIPRYPPYEEDERSVCFEKALTTQT